MQEGQVEYARRKSAPSWTSLSRFGVRTTGCPSSDRQSPRIWSGMRKRISGLGAAALAPGTPQTTSPANRTNNGIIRGRNPAFLYRFIATQLSFTDLNIRLGRRRPGTRHAANDQPS